VIKKASGSDISAVIKGEGAVLNENKRYEDVNNE
jgi:hypothetical protein